jgi:hypothetical protein
MKLHLVPILYEAVYMKAVSCLLPCTPHPNIFSQMTWPQIAEPCMQLLILPSLETHFLAPGPRHSCTSIILSSFLSASSFFPPCFYFPVCDVCKCRECTSTVFDEILNRRCCMLQLVIDKAWLWQKTSYRSSEDVAHFQVAHNPLQTSK